jgi:quercetin dioxygenase-like cupin family protein
VKRIAVGCATLLALGVSLAVGGQEQPGEERRGAVVAWDGGYPVPFPDGRLVRIKVGPLSTGSTDFVVLSEDLPPGAAVPTHRHLRDEEALFVHRGSVTVSLGEQQEVIEAGDTVYLPPKVWIGIKNHTSHPATMVSIFAHSDVELCFRLLAKVAAGEATGEEQAEQERRCAWETPSGQTATRTVAEKRAVIIRAGEGNKVAPPRGHAVFIFKVGPAASGATRLVLGTADMPQGAASPVHRHERDEEIIFVQKGQMTVTLGGRQAVAEAGAAVYVRRGTWMELQSTGDEPATIFGGFAHPAMEECFLRHISEGISHHDPRWPEVNRLCQMTYK